VTTQPEPAAKPAKPRLLQDGRDMFWSIAPLVVACIVLAGVVGMCSFSPGGINRGPVPAYDAASALKADALTLGFPVRRMAAQFRGARRHRRRPDRPGDRRPAACRHLHRRLHQPGR
jgi:hypothetical protein